MPNPPGALGFATIGISHYLFGVLISQNKRIYAHSMTDRHAGRQVDRQIERGRRLCTATSSAARRLPAKMHVSFRESIFFTAKKYFSLTSRQCMGKDNAFEMHFHLDNASIFHCEIHVSLQTCIRRCIFICEGVFFNANIFCAQCFNEV